MMKRIKSWLALNRVHKIHKKENVIGHYFDNKGKLQVFVTAKLPESVLEKKDLVPKEFYGVKTNVVERDMPKALASDAGSFISNTYKVRTRPYQPGQSISDIDPNYKSAGTLGLIVNRRKYFLGSVPITPWIRDMMSEKLVAKFGIKVVKYPVGVTNRHVAYKLGVQVVQPGTLDGGKVSTDCIGKVEACGKYTAKQPIDISIIKLDTNVPYKSQVLNFREILKIKPMGASNGAMVKKSGRTSMISYGQVVGRVNIMVDMGDHGEVMFKDVYEVDWAGENIDIPMLLAGDSGSSVFDSQGNFVGLGFAGGSRYSYVIPASRIFGEFGLESM